MAVHGIRIIQLLSSLSQVPTRSITTVGCTGRYPVQGWLVHGEMYGTRVAGTWGNVRYKGGWYMGRLDLQYNGWIQWERYSTMVGCNGEVLYNGWIQG